MFNFFITVLEVFGYETESHNHSMSMPWSALRQFGVKTNSDRKPDSAQIMSLISLINLISMKARPNLFSEIIPILQLILIKN